MGTMLSSAGTAHVQSARHQCWYQKISVLTVLSVPVYVLSFFLTYIPLFAGSAILFSQYQLYQKDYQWYELSVLDAATQSVHPKLTARLKEPMLSTCAQAPEISMSHYKIRTPKELRIPAVDMEIKSGPKVSCIQSSAWIAWLEEPDSWQSVHMILVPPMGTLSVPMLLFATSLLTHHFFLKFKKTLAAKRKAENFPQRG